MERDALRSQIIGMTLSSVEALLKQQQLEVIYRIESLENEKFCTTTDWKPNRFNLTVLGGVVTAVRVG